MKRVEITSVELDETGQNFVVRKDLSYNDSSTGFNQHFIPVIAIGNYARHYGITEDEAIDLILFDPLRTEEDEGETLMETIENCKRRLHSAQGNVSARTALADDYDGVRQFIKNKCREKDNGKVQQAHLDVLDRGSTVPRSAAPGSERGPDGDASGVDHGVQRVPGTIRDAGGSGEPTDA